MTEWRALCEELAEDVRYLSECLRDPDSGVDPVCLSGAEADYHRARALLAQPEPEGVGPSVEELDELFNEIDQSGEPLSWRAYARAVLARWGRPAPVPVAVSDRLPQPEDCDAEGFIWLWDCERRWVRQCRAAASSNTWTGAHWLPGWFLPLPSGEVE